MTSPDAPQAREEVVKSSSGRPMYRIAIRTAAVHFIVPRDGLSERLVRELKRQFTHTLEQVLPEETRGRMSLGEHASRSGVSESTSASA